MTDSDYPDGPRLRELFLAEKELYDRLIELAGRQMSCIAATDEKGFMAVVAEKQVLIDRLDIIEKELKNVKADWLTVRDGIEPDLVPEIESIASEIEVAIKVLLEADEGSQKKLQKQRGEMLDRIRSAQAGKAAARSYAPKPIEDNRFLDERT